MCQVTSSKAHAQKCGYFLLKFYQVSSVLLRVRQRLPNAMPLQVELQCCLCVLLLSQGNLTNPPKSVLPLAATADGTRIELSVYINIPTKTAMYVL